MKQEKEMLIDAMLLLESVAEDIENCLLHGELEPSKELMRRHETLVAGAHYLVQALYGSIPDNYEQIVSEALEEAKK